MSRYRAPAGGYIQLSITSGVRGSAFLEEKVVEIKNFLPTKAEIAPHTSTGTNGARTPCTRFRVSSPRLRPVYNLLYPGGERRITRNVLDMLGGRAAAWLWADGAKPFEDGDFYLLRKVGTSQEEAALVAGWLQVLTGAESEFSYQYYHPRLMFSREEASKIVSATRQYAPPSRIHLFNLDQPNECEIRSARSELQLR